MKNYRAELTGVFGDPVDDNPTGVIEEAAFVAKQLNYRYLTLKVIPEDLQQAMESVRIFGMKGINLTMPHKINVLPYLDELSPAADIIGAVNTVIQKDGRLLGENTDGKGFVIALTKSGETLEGKTVTILGAGGAARAIAVECALSGASHINIINRSCEKGEGLVALLHDRTSSTAKFFKWKTNMEVPDGTNILINATSIGFLPKEGDRPDINYAAVTSDMCVCDVVFNPAETRFLKQAKENGAKTITGLGMLVQQAALNFELWTGEDAPVEVMEDALRKELDDNIMKLSDIHHVAIISSNYEEAKRFYVDKLGFDIVRENYRPERKDWKIDLRVNASTELEIFIEADAPGRVNRPEACGLRHLSFKVESVDACVRKLEKQGIQCEPIRSDDYTGKKLTFFLDPDGLPIELHE